jgi:hypothetical protein
MYLSYRPQFLLTFISSPLLLLINGCIIKHSFTSRKSLANRGLLDAIYQASHKNTLINQRYS